MILPYNINKCLQAGHIFKPAIVSELTEEVNYRKSFGASGEVVLINFVYVLPKKLRRKLGRCYTLVTQEGKNLLHIW